MSKIPPQLEGYPERIQEDYVEFRETGSSDALSSFVLKTLGFLSDGDDGSEALLSIPDDAQILEQPGIDSLAFAELVFLIEDLFEYSITDEQMRSVETVGDLKRLMNELLGPTSASPSQ